MTVFSLSLFNEDSLYGSVREKHFFVPLILILGNIMVALPVLLIYLRITIFKF